MNLRQNIIAMRKYWGHTQAELAILIGVSTQLLDDWEEGRAEPSMDQLLAIQDTLHVGADILLRGTLYAYTERGLHELVHGGSMLPRPKVA